MKFGAEYSGKTSAETVGAEFRHLTGFQMPEPSGRKILVGSLGISAIIYSVVVLGYVGTTPDVRLRSLLADSENVAQPGIVIRGVEGVRLPVDIPPRRPREGDVLTRLADQPIRSFLDYVRTLQYLRDAPILTDGILHVGADPFELEPQDLPALIEIGTDRYVEVYLYRASDGSTIQSWIQVQSLPLGEVLLSFLWLVLQLAIFAASALAAWHRPFDNSARLFFQMCAVSMVAFIGGFHWWVLSGNLILNLPFVFCALLLPAVSLHFFLTYPRRLLPMELYPKQTSVLIYVIPVVTGVVMMGLLGAAWWMTTPDMSPESIDGVSWCLAALRDTIYAYLVFAAVCFFGILVALAGEYFSTSNVLEQSQMKWIFRAGIVSAVPISYTLYLALFHRTEFALGSARLPMFLASLSFMLAYSVGIVRYKLMLVDDFVSRGVLYFVASQGLTLGYGVCVALVALFADDLNVDWVIPGRFQHLLSVGVLLTFSVVVLSWSRDRIHQTIDRRFYREKYQLDKALQRVNRAADNVVTRHTLGQQMLDSCRDVLGVQLAALYIRETGGKTFRLVAIEGLGSFPEQLEADEEILQLLHDDVAIQRVSTGNDAVRSRENLRELNCELMFAISSDGEVDGVVALARRRSGAAYSAEDLTFINTLAQFTGVALRSAKVQHDYERVNDELRIKANKIDEQRQQIALMQAELTGRSTPKKLPGSMETQELDRGMIRGNSPAIKKVLDMVQKVAKSESTVLIQGASGTGKELLAQAIHGNSARRNGPMVQVHCAALSPGLLESELFGHVKGSFTGAHKDRVGRFELANGGTLFLDEIGDISLETQIKLLRVLQTRSFEPVGGTRTVNVDVRLITATHQDLPKLIKEGRFREDLFYRLNVVNITLPTLAERREDIFELAVYFLGKASSTTGKSVSHIDDASIEALKAYSWPGNIRELENVIERAVVLCEGDRVTLQEFSDEIRAASPEPSDSVFDDETTMPMTPSDSVLLALPAPAVKSVRSTMAERQPIRPESDSELLRRTLQECDGNKSHAARKLGIPRSTLFSRLKKAGLT